MSSVKDHETGIENGSPDAEPSLSTDHEAIDSENCGIL